VNLSVSLITIILAASVSPSPIPEPVETESDSFHLNREKKSQTDVENSISNIAAQLLMEEEPTSLEKLPKLESNSENQAKVVDHIKGLLSDIVTNTVVDDNTETNMLFIKNSEGLMKNTPTILQTVYGLDSNTIKDKESFIKIINKMTEREKETTEGSITTNYVSVFDNKKNNNADLQKNILDQYLEYYDHEDSEMITTTEKISVKSATTPTTTSSTTTSTSTTSSTTPSTTPSTTKSTTTTEQTTTTTTAAPTLLERAGSFVTGGIGGIFDGFASLSQAFTPFWIPIQLGRKRRDVREDTMPDSDAIEESITDRDIFMNFLLFQKRIKAMNPEKLNNIVKGVVKTVINTEPTGDVDEMENIYDEVIARQVTELLLRPKPFSKDIIDSSVSENYL